MDVILKGRALLCDQPFGFFRGCGGGQFSAARASAGGPSRPPLFAALLVRFVSIVSSFALLSSLFLSCSWFAVRGFVCLYACVCTRLIRLLLFGFPKSHFEPEGRKDHPCCYWVAIVISLSRWSFLVVLRSDVLLLGVFVKAGFVPTIAPCFGAGEVRGFSFGHNVRPARGNSLLAFCCSAGERAGGGGECFCGILARYF